MTCSPRTRWPATARNWTRSRLDALLKGFHGCQAHPDFPQQSPGGDFPDAGVGRGGGYCFYHINVEAYPDPVPPIIEVVAQFPGASAQEVERQATIPLEVTLAVDRPGRNACAWSLCSASRTRAISSTMGSVTRMPARKSLTACNSPQPAPRRQAPQVSRPLPSVRSTDTRCRIRRNALGQDIYSLEDLKALQDWLLEREFKRVDRIIDVSGVGGTVKRYEIHPDPERLRRYGITLGQLQNTIGNSNANVGGDYLKRGLIVEVVRNVGVIGSGKDPMELAAAMKTPEEAAAFLRAEDLRRASTKFVCSLSPPSTTYRSTSMTLCKAAPFP